GAVRLAQQADGDRRQPQGLAQAVAERLAGPAPGEPRGEFADGGFRTKIDGEPRRPVARNGVPHLRRKGVDRAALQAIGGDDRLAALRAPRVRQADPLQRLAGEPVLEELSPGDLEPAVGWT